MHDFRIPSDDILIEQDIGEDNFAEDSGGIYFADESSCFAFDPDETIQKKASPMTKKVDAWKKLCEDAKLEKLKLLEPKYTQRELLQALDNQEASDYCKYLQIPVKVSDSKDDKTDAVCKMLQLHLEYLLYIFIQENYDALCKLSDYSCGEIGKSSWQKNAVAAALMVGLCDFQEKADAGELSFALDIKPLLKK